MTPDVFNQLARNRRSIFPDQFDTDKKVDDTIIMEILTNAIWAPNHGRVEPLQLTVFCGKGVQKFAHFQSELCKSLAGDNLNEITYSKLQQQLLKASHIITIGMKRSQYKNIPEVEDIEAVACAVQNIYLSVAAYGLGGYWTTGGITYKEEAKSFFGLGDNDRLPVFFYIGHIAIPSTGATRKTIEEKVNWIKE
ncbi:MAG: nitroreductase [Bacteroidota bacterium]|nr:nitroreductase [Bacteroidota bacterium]